MPTTWTARRRRAVRLGERVALDERRRVAVVVQLGVDTGDAARAVGDDTDVVFDEHDRDAVVVEPVEKRVERVS
jgi:hypothetical protein